MLAAGSGFFTVHIMMGMLSWYCTPWFPATVCTWLVRLRCCHLTVMLLQFGHAQHFEHELHQEGHHEATEGH